MSDWYAKLSGRFWRHEKRASLSDAGVATWVDCLSYCIDNRTDGLVTPAMLKRVRPHDADVRSDELLTSGLWDRDPAGFRFHDFSDHSLTTAKWDAKKAADREYQRKSRERKSHVRSDNGLTESRVNTETSADSPREDSGLRTQDVKSDLRLKAKTGFAARYAKLHAFPHGGLDGRPLEIFCVWAEGKPDPEAFAMAALDGYFADPFWVKAKHPIDGFKDYDRYAAGKMHLAKVAADKPRGPRKRAELLDGAEAVGAPEALVAAARGGNR